MKKITQLFLLFALAMGFNGCDKDDDTNPNNGITSASGSFSKNFGSSVSRDFIGQIVNTQNQPVAGASVKIGASNVQTDANGVFIINDADVHERFAYITATKTGFLNGSRALIPTKGKNNIKIMLIPSDAVQTIASGEVSEVTLPSGTKVSFDGAFQDENGNSYSGDVSVSMFHLSPSNENLRALMPGMLYAEDQSGKEKMLKTFGMLNVELRGVSGQKLQIASGHTAQISMLIDNSQLATAPSTIALWHFDEANGYWKEDGTATKQGNKYVGNVSHFSWWNCDDSFPTVSLTVNVVDANGNPPSYLKIELYRSGDTTPATAYTDNDGQASGLVPANEVLTMKIYDSCGNLISTSSVGPFSTDTILPQVVLAAGSTTLVQGNLVKCDMSNVTNGYVMLRSQNGIQLAAVTNGNFSFSTLACNTDTSFSLRGVDYDNLQSTGEITYNYTMPVTNIGNLIACNAITEFISFKIDNNPVVFLLDNLTAGDNGVLTITASTQDVNITITGDTSGTGTYSTDVLSLSGSVIGYIGSQTTNDIVYNLNSLGAVGQFVDMTFNGTYTEGVTTHTVTGVVHVTRDY